LSQDGMEEETPLWEGFVTANILKEKSVRREGGGREIQLGRTLVVYETTKFLFGVITADDIRKQRGGFW